MGTWVVVFIVLGAAFWFARYARPEFPPLETRPDDPLMIEAREKAIASVPEFKTLFDKYPGDALIKLRFVSNSGQTEYLWSEVLSRKA